MNCYAVLLFSLATIDINFNNIGIALISISLVFPILDKLTGRSIEDFKNLRKRVKEDKRLNKQSTDELISRIDDIIDTLNQKSVLGIFRKTVSLAFLFLVFSTFYNAYQKAPLLIILITYLLFFSIYLFIVVGSQIKERKKHITLTKDFHNILGDPVVALNKTLKDNT